ncbi:P-loop containing nucleoside triphosphate hydrolase protein [Infundibulicybe gibba]|nr:P-loop containing nucleoside triphosphate hydrolase protein [Infundibulicybe gibba]
MRTVFHKIPFKWTYIHLCTRIGGIRSLTTRANDDASKIRNMALVAHIDSGKTTLTESILLKSSYLSTRGSVDTGSTTTDFLPAERERGITIQSASIPVKWKDWSFNLIDTPGHADFGMEVESASRVIDGAVVLIDSVEGVEAQTKGVWRQLDRYGVATRLMFLNKLDRPGASFKSSLISLLTHRFHPRPLALTLPIASFDPDHYSRGEPGIEGLVDLVKWEVWKWNEQGQSTRYFLPVDVAKIQDLELFPPSHPIIPHLVSARTELLENLSMFSEEFMEQLLDLPPGPSSYISIPGSTIIPYLRQATLQNNILPVLCGSAIKNIGTDLVMDYVGELLASPLDVPHEAQGKNAPLRMLAWKVGWDKKRGWMTFVRVYSGKLTRQTRGVSKLLLLYASQAEEVEELPFGSVGVILGLKYTRTGDTLVSTGSSTFNRSSLREIVPPPAVISSSIIPQSHSDLEPVQAALESLARTDPSVRVEMQDGQLLVHGLGALHLEIVEGRLRDEWNVQFELGKRRVSYREGLGYESIGINSDVWETDIGGKHITVSLTLDVRPLADDETGDPIGAYIARGIANSLSNSPHTTLAMTHLWIQVKNFEIQPASLPSILAGASAVILRDRIRQAAYVQLKITVNEDSLGKTVKDLTEHGGEVLDLGTGSIMASDGTEEIGGYSEDGVYIPPLWLSPSAFDSSNGTQSSHRLKRSIQALAPLSKTLDYSNRLRFRKVSETRKLEILKEIGRA